MRKYRGVIIGLVAALVVVAVLVYVYRNDISPRHATLVLSGNVDIRQANLAFRVGGRVKEVLVDEGDVIGQPGQLLAVIDAEPLQNALDQAQANLTAAEANLALMTAGYRQEDIAQARAQLQTQQAQLVNAQKMLARQQQLAGTGAIPASTLDDARAARDQAAGQVEAARQNYEALSRGYRVEEVEQARAQAEQARAAVATARLQLEDAQLTAPSTGVIITRAVEVGSMVSAGTTAFTLSLNDPVWVRAYVEEPDLGRVAPGTAVVIYTDSPDGKTYEGVIGFVSPTAEFTPKQVQTQDLRTGLVYRIRVVVRNPDEGLRQGMPVTVKLAADASS